MSPTMLPELGTPTSPSSSVSSGETFTVKVILEDVIVLLRVPVGISLGEMRQRISEKYEKQEGVNLSPSFIIGCAVPSPEREASLKGRPRSNSASSRSALQSVRAVTTESEWRSTIDSSVGKLSIRLFNAH